MPEIVYLDFLVNCWFIHIVEVNCYLTMPSNIFSEFVPFPLLTFSIECWANVQITDCTQPIASMSYLCSVFSIISMNGKIELLSARLCAPKER